MGVRDELRRDYADRVLAASTINPAKVADLAGLGHNWDSYGAAPPTNEALAILRNTAVVPTKDGGVQFEWHVNGWEVELEFGFDGRPIGVHMERA